MIFDEKNRLSVQNEYEFEDNGKWIFVISNFSWYTPIFEILELEIK